MKRVLRRAWPLLAAALVAFVASNLYVHVRGKRDIVSLDAIPPDRDTVIVLGAGVWRDGPSPVLEDRLATALTLQRRGVAPRLLLTGDHHTAAYDEPGAMRRWLLERDVPDAALVLDHAGLDTYSSMVRARDVFGARRVVVVTQRFHLPRALYLARGLGLDAVGIEAAEVRYHENPMHVARELLSRPVSFLDRARGRTPRHPR